MKLALVLLVCVCGCAFDRQSYVDDTGATYSRTLSGVGFRIDKDIAGATLIWDENGGSATIGKETEGIDALTGFEKGLEASGQMLGTLMPFLMLQGQPSVPTTGTGPFATIIQSVTDAVIAKLLADGVIEPAE